MKDKCKICPLKKYMVLEILIFLAVLALDIFLKRYAENNLQGNSVTFIPGIINLIYVENTGAAFGILKDRQLFFKILTVIALSVFVFYIYKKRKGHILLRISLALIIAGTAGNFIDRVNLGYVVDMIELQFIDFAIFNIADSALTVGVTLFAIYYLFIYKEPKKEDKCGSGQNIEQDTQNNNDLNG